MSAGFRCPTCRAPWRGVTACPRCGGDLSAVMRVAHRAWELRGAARLALRAGDRAAGAVALANAARRLHRTPRGERLLALALIATGQVAQARAIIEDAIGHDAGTTRQPVEAPSPEPADAAESPDQPDQSP